MSDMNLEKAKVIVAACDYDDPMKEITGVGYDVAHAQGFLDGHASRDPEVEKLNAAINCLRLLKDEAKAEVADLKKDLALNASMLARQCDLAREAEGEVEKLKHEIECLRIQHRAWTDSFGTTQLTHALAAVQAEREKLKSYTKEKFSCPCGETTYLLEQHPNHFVGCISHNPTEVEKLKAEERRLEAQQKAWNGMLFCNGETYRSYATPEGGVVPVVEPVKVTRILDELSAEREASRKLAETAQDVVWCLRKHVTIHDSCAAHLEEALKFYVTAGHSPEGKTL